MNIKVSAKEFKEINESLYKQAQKEMKTKNLIWEDVTVLFNVELKNSEMPSKTFLEYRRKIKSQANEGFYDILKVWNL